MLQYQGPATIRYANQHGTQQSPSRAYPTPKQTSEIVVVTVATTRRARGEQPRHEGWSATALEVSLDAQRGSPKSACAFSAENSPTVQIRCLVFFAWLKDRLLGSWKTLGKPGTEHRSLRTSPNSVYRDDWEISAEGWETESMQDAGYSMWHSCLI